MVLDSSQAFPIRQLRASFLGKFLNSYLKNPFPSVFCFFPFGALFIIFSLFLSFCLFATYPLSSKHSIEIFFSFLLSHFECQELLLFSKYPLPPFKNSIIFFLHNYAFYYFFLAHIDSICLNIFSSAWFLFPSDCFLSFFFFSWLPLFILDVASDM